MKLVKNVLIIVALISFTILCGSVVEKNNIEVEIIKQLQIRR